MHIPLGHGKKARSFRRGSPLLIALMLAGCGGGGTSAPPPEAPMSAPAMVSLRILATEPTNTTVPVILRAGMIFGSEYDVIMTRPTGTIWEASISAPEGTILRYAYRLNGDWNRKESYEHRPGRFRYRELLVVKNAVVNDTIARWEGSFTTGATGALTGRVYDQFNRPVMGMTISAGPYQTMSLWDGSFSIQGVPAGPCAVTVYADNGEYAPVLSGTTIPSNGASTKDIALTQAAMVPVTFSVAVPADTPANAVPRLYGNARRLGMFPSFEGTATDPSRVIDMVSAGLGTWTSTALLGKGSCYQYLYTLGDNRVNHERDGSGSEVVRSFCVTGAMTLDDSVVSWKAPGQVPVTLTVSSPSVSDMVSVTTDGWGGYEPLRMWQLGAGQWQYVLYTNPVTPLSYRYVRNSDPAIGPEIVPPDQDPPLYRSLNTGATGTAVNDTITAWRHELREVLPSPATLKSSGTVTARKSGEPFQTGVEFIDYWRPAWKPLVAPSMARVKEKNATWVQIPSVWGLVSVDPPIIDRGWNSFTTEELADHIRAAKAQGLKVALRPFAYPVSSAEEAGFTRTNTNEWYDRFFDQVKAMYRYHAMIAQQEGVEMMILGNFNWADNDDSFADEHKASRQHINQKWSEVVAAVRQSYTGAGKITTDYHVERPEYYWYQNLDYLGDKWWWPLASSGTATVGDMHAAAVDKLNSYYLPLSQRWSNMPFVFAEVGYYSADSSAQQTYGVYDREIDDFKSAMSLPVSDWDEQAMAYEAVLRAFAETPWVQGCYSFGYAYFDFDSKGYSVRGKTAEEVMSRMYQQLNAVP